VIDLGKWSRVLCYPRESPGELEARLEELRQLGVEGLTSRGRVLIGHVRVLGKGCVGIVVEALTAVGRAVLKVRRVDADRPSLEGEAKVLKKVNEMSIGPRLLGYTRDFILMELVEGPHLEEWLSEVEAMPQGCVEEVLRSLLTQCHRLDAVGVDHGELSRAGRHVIVSPRGPVIIDFESSSLTRRPRNLSSITQYLVIRSGAWPKIARRLGVEARAEEVFKLLRSYKQEPCEEVFKELLSLLGLKA